MNVVMDISNTLKLCKIMYLSFIRARSTTDIKVLAQLSENWTNEHLQMIYTLILSKQNIII